MIYGLVVIIPASTANYARVFENLRARSSCSRDFEMFSMEGNQLNATFYAHSARLARGKIYFHETSFAISNVVWKFIYNGIHEGIRIFLHLLMKF